MADLGSISVLVVDDSPTMRGIIVGVLRDAGLTDVTQAEGGAKAWEILQEKAVGLVLCDWNMPGMSGVELLTAMRADARFKATPFIMVTTQNQKENIIAAVKQGVSGYLIKPFSSQKLAEKIRQVL